MKNYDSVFQRIDTLDSLLLRLGRREFEAVEFLKQLHSDVFGKPFDGNCPNCIQKAYKTLKNLTIENLNIMESKKYQLKKGKLIRIAYTQEAYTNENLTDKIAQKLLKDNPERISLFSKFPSDWKKAGAEKSDEGLWSDGLKQADLKAIYEKEVGEVPSKIKNADMINTINGKRLEAANRDESDKTE